MTGNCKQASVAESIKARSRHAERFPAKTKDTTVTKMVADAMDGLRFFIFIPSEIKILDEPRFGEETYVTLVREP